MSEAYLDYGMAAVVTPAERGWGAAMGEQRTTPEQRQVLRRRYTPEPAPTCAYCHRGPMVRMPPQPMDPSYVHWRCPHDNYGTATSVGQPEIVAAIDDADALAEARAEVARLRAKAEALVDVLDTLKSLAAHAEEMTPMLTEPAIWWADALALVEKAQGCAKRMTAPVPAPAAGATDAR